MSREKIPKLAGDGSKITYLEIQRGKRKKERGKQIQVHKDPFRWSLRHAGIRKDKEISVHAISLHRAADYW